MKSGLNCIQEYYRTIDEKDQSGLRSILADDFSFHGPMMAFGDPDSFAKAMVALPFEATAKDSRFIANGDLVAHVFVWQMTRPAKADIPMCEVFTVDSGKVRRSELYFDTHLFPGG